MPTENPSDVSRCRMRRSPDTVQRQSSRGSRQSPTYLPDTGTPSTKGNVQTREPLEVYSWNSQSGLDSYRLIQLTDSLPGLVGYVDLHLRIVYANKLIEEWYQRPRSELIGTELRTLFSPEHYEIVKTLLDRVLAGDEINEEREIRYPDGVTRVVHLNYIPDRSDDGVHGYFFLVRDVTKRARAEQALVEANAELDRRIRRATAELESRNRELKASEERYRVVSDLMSDLVYVYEIERDGRMKAVWYAGRLSSEFSPRPDQDGGHRIWEPVVHPEDLLILRQRIKKLMRNEVSIDEFRVIDPRGRPRWLRTYGKPVWSADEGRVVQVMAAAQDITETKLAEQQLENNREMLNEALESMSDGFMLLDESKNLVAANEKLKRLFPAAAHHMKPGTQFEDLLRASAYAGEVKDAQDDPEVWIGNRLKDYPQDTGAVEVELADGRWILSTDRSTRAGGVVGIRTDITDRKQAEEQLRQHETELAHVLRRSSMGEMASALAHELSQPLAAVVNYANGSLRRLDRGEMDMVALRDALERISRSADRAKAIVKHVGDFVRPDQLTLKNADLRDLITEVCDLLRGALRRNNVRLTLNLPNGPAYAMVNRLQVEQVLFNLLRNGVDATKDAERAQRRLQICLQTVTPDHVIAVTDNGCGVDQSLENQVFEPYVTTKSNGLGMGLSISRTIAEAHGGRLWFEPVEPAGTRFSFRLPAVGETFESNS